MFAFFGMGPLQNEIREKVHRMGLINNVLFHGHCSKPQIYSSIDIMLLPSIVEGLGMVNVEASESGIPICAFDVGGVGEIVEHGKSGLLSNVRDSASMAKNVMSLIDNPALAADLARGAQLRIKNMFDPPEKGALLENSLVSAKDAARLEKKCLDIMYMSKSIKNLRYLMINIPDRIRSRVSSRFKFLNKSLKITPTILGNEVFDY